MSETEKGIQQIWYNKYNDLGYALGKDTILFLLFEKKREKEIDRLWSKHIEPFEDEEFKIRFVEDKDEYTFIMYREPKEKESRFGFYRSGFNVKGHYTKFKKNFQDELLFSYGITDDEKFRLSDRYKIISDIKILKGADIERGSCLWDLLDLENTDE